MGKPSATAQTARSVTGVTVVRQPPRCREGTLGCPNRRWLVVEPREALWNPPALDLGVWQRLRNGTRFHTPAQADPPVPGGSGTTKSLGAVTQAPWPQEDRGTLCPQARHNHNVPEPGNGAESCSPAAVGSCCWVGEERRALCAHGGSVGSSIPALFVGDPSNEDIPKAPRLRRFAVRKTASSAENLARPDHKLPLNLHVVQGRMRANLLPALEASQRL